MIKNSDSLSMAEASEYIIKKPDSDIDMGSFIKKFTSLKPKEAKEIRKSLEELNLMQLNELHISKMIDLMPDNSRDLSKILVDVNLNDDETNKILEIIKKHK